MCFWWSVKKHWVAKILQEIWERFSYENNRNLNFYKFRYKLMFIPFLCFHWNQKEESIFQQVGRLVTEIALLIWQTYYTFGYLFLLHISQSQTSTIVPQEIPYLMPNMVFLFKSTGRTKIICCRKSSIIS